MIVKPFANHLSKHSIFIAVKAQLILALAAISLVASCRKEEQRPGQPRPESGRCRLIAEKNADSSGTIYVLDTNGNIVESVTRTSSGSVTSTSVFEYTDGVLSAIVDYLDEDKKYRGWKTTYKREGDKITTTRYGYNVSAQQYYEIWRLIQTVNAADYLVREELYQDKNGTLALDLVKEYTTDDRGNTISARFFEDGKQTQTYTYEYDNKPNWKLAHQIYTVQKTSTNNLVKLNVWDSKGTIKSQITYSYKYYPDGYPSSMNGKMFTYKWREK
jgi:hypothetical protein